MKPIIFAIGNPGERYARTYHSLGLMLADFLEMNCDSMRDQCVLLKSNVYMNNSADALRKYKNLDPKKLLVLHDDLTLNKFVVRLKYGGGLAGHNGLRSINQLIGSDFTRLRIGIGYPDKMPIDEYVLSKIDDIPKFEQETFKDACVLVNNWIIAVTCDL